MSTDSTLVKAALVDNSGLSFNYALWAGVVAYQIGVTVIHFGTAKIGKK